MGSALAYAHDLWDSIVSVIRMAHFMDIIDILILSYIIYKGLNLVRETRAEQLLKGIGIFTAAYVLVEFLQMTDMQLTTIGFFMQNFFQVGIIAVIIMFQPELRRALEKMGRTRVSNLTMFASNPDALHSVMLRWAKCVDAIVDASKSLSSTMTGALIVIERMTRLGEQIDTGTILGAAPSAELLGNIFFPNSPLHDGAVIIREGNIHAAGCFLPKPQKEELISKNLGSRHRAAIGMSEISDSIVIVVSEETGIISVAENGQLTRGFTQEGLRLLLESALMPDKTAEEKDKPAWFKRKPKKI